jgi:hypothetical protein
MCARNTRWAGRPTGRNMKRCAVCHGKLGLGARPVTFGTALGRFIFDFVSSRCEAIYQKDEQNDAAKGRWHAFLAGGARRS